MAAARVAVAAAVWKCAMEHPVPRRRPRAGNGGPICPNGRTCIEIGFESGGVAVVLAVDGCEMG